MYLSMQAPTEEDLDTFEWVPFTADNKWDPTGVSSPAAADNDLSLQLPAGHVPFRDERIDNFGLLAHSAAFSQSPLNADALQPNFGWVPSARISRTFENTTQFARADAHLLLHKHFKSRFPAAKVSRLNEIVATDTFVSDTPAANDGIFNHGGGGAIMAQLFVGKSSQITSVFPIANLSLPILSRTLFVPMVLPMPSSATMLVLRSVSRHFRFCVCMQSTICSASRTISTKITRNAAFKR
jgi:hypothetical protein